MNTCYEGLATLSKSGNLPQIIQDCLHDHVKEKSWDLEHAKRNSKSCSPPPNRTPRCRRTPFTLS